MEEAFRIVTQRLELRPWRETDRAVFRQFVSDATLMHYISGRSWDENNIDEFFARQGRNLQERGYCLCAVIPRGGNTPIGTVGLQPQLLAGEDELAWWIGHEWQGRGFASEIGAACLRYGLDVLGRPRIVAITDPENAASVRVMEKIGMRYVDTVIARTLEARYPDTPVLRYAATATQ